MASSAIQHGIPISLKELEPSSVFFKQGASLRVTGILQAYNVNTAVAIIMDEGVKLNIDTQHLRDTSFRIGSIYQFIGELQLRPENDAILLARIGKIVDGLDLKLYYQTMMLLRQYETEITSSMTT